MRGQRYPEEFKIETVKQVTERGHSIPEVAKRLGVTSKSLYAWVDRYSQSPEERARGDSQAEELRTRRCLTVKRSK